MSKAEILATATLDKRKTDLGTYPRAVIRFIPSRAGSISSLYGAKTNLKSKKYSREYVRILKIKASHNKRPKTPQNYSRKKTHSSIFRFKNGPLLPLLLLVTSFLNILTYYMYLVVYECRIAATAKTRISFFRKIRRRRVLGRMIDTYGMQQFWFIRVVHTGVWRTTQHRPVPGRIGADTGCAGCPRVERPVQCEEYTHTAACLSTLYDTAGTPIVLLLTILVETKIRQDNLILAAGRVRSKKKKRKTKTRNPVAPKTHHEIHSSPATATTLRRHPASIGPGFTKIGHVCTTLAISKNDECYTRRQTD